MTESESDRGRVLFCAAFRRLQQKAQVFSMEPNAAVRSRLTHSLEVSQIGRYLADQIGRKLAQGSLASTEQQTALVNFVETACLMHDIGNPPFGHFGEAAIKRWFQENGAAVLRKSCRLKRGKLGSGDDRLIAALADFEEFDGNPQGLRVVTKLQWNSDRYGLNLTKTTLASFLKYVRQAGQEPSGNFTKKAGFFSTERQTVENLWEEFGYARPQRFPLAYIMEAADDIAYCISDLEDSIEKGLVALNAALSDVLIRYEQLGDKEAPTYAPIKSAVENARDGKKPDGTPFTYTDFRTLLNRTIVEYAADRYLAHHDSVIDGSLDALLPRSEPPGAILESLKEYCQQNVYRHESIQRIELAGYTAIRGLLDHFRSMLELGRSDFNSALSYSNSSAVAIEKKLLRLFPEKHLKVYHETLSLIGGSDADSFSEWNARAHLVVDFISGMTDDFAMTTYRTLAGMRL